MLSDGELCLFTKPGSIDLNFGEVKSVCIKDNQVTISSLGEDEITEHVPTNHVFRLDCKTKITSALKQPSGSRALQEIDCVFFLKKLQRALCLEDDPDSLVEMQESQPLEPQDWNVGDVCVLRWSEDDEWYYAEIICIEFDTRTCGVSYLYYGNEEYAIPLDALSHYDSPEAFSVVDQDNIRAVTELLKDSRLPWHVEQLESAQVGPSDPVAAAPITPPSTSTTRINLSPDVAQSPQGRKTGEEEIQQLNQPPPSLSRLKMPPLDLRRHLLDADEAPLQALLTSWFMCGYHTGYYEGLKAKKST